MFLLFDIFIIILGIFKLLNIDIFNQILEKYFSGIYGSNIVLIICIISIIFSLGFGFINFVKLAQAGENPRGRRDEVRLLLYSGVKLLLSIISFIIFLIISNKGNILLYIIGTILGLIIICIIIKLICNLVEWIRDKIHGL